MFRCAACEQVISPRTPSREVVVDVRPTRYPHRRGVQASKGKNRRKRKTWKDDPGGQGWEPARTVRMCQRCAAEAEAKLDAYVETHFEAEAA